MSWQKKAPDQFGWYWYRCGDDDVQPAYVIPDEGIFNTPFSDGDRKLDEQGLEWIHDPIPMPDRFSGRYELGRSKIKCNFDSDEIELEGPAMQVDSAFGAFMFAVAHKHKLPTSAVEIPEDDAPQKPIVQRAAKPAPRKSEPRKPEAEHSADERVADKDDEDDTYLAEVKERLDAGDNAYVSWPEVVAIELPGVSEPFSRRDVLGPVLARVEKNGLVMNGDPHSNVSQALTNMERKGLIVGAGVGNGGAKLYRRAGSTPASNGHAHDEEDLLDLDQARSMIESGDRSSDGVVELCTRLRAFGWAELDSNLWRITEPGHREWTAMQERLLKAQGVEP